MATYTFLPMKSSAAKAMSLAKRIAERFAAIPEVEAVALAGSRQSHFADENSDIDLYVYASAIVPLQQRAEVAGAAERAELGNSFWEPGDEWVDLETGISVDVMYRTTPWIEDQLDRVLRRHEASVGYSTCFWYNVRNSLPLFDRIGWFQMIQEKANMTYPQRLKHAVLAKNYPILRKNMSSYRHQIELSLERNDAFSVNHRITALLASYFDILFAVNEQPHPGEKRLVRFAEALCPRRPRNMAEQVKAVVEERTLSAVDALLDGLDGILEELRLVPSSAP